MGELAQVAASLDTPGANLTLNASKDTIKLASISTSPRSLRVSESESLSKAFHDRWTTVQRERTFTSSLKLAVFKQCFGTTATTIRPKHYQAWRTMSPELPKRRDISGNETLPAYDPPNIYMGTVVEPKMDSTSGKLRSTFPRFLLISTHIETHSHELQPTYWKDDGLLFSLESVPM